MPDYKSTTGRTRARPAPLIRTQVLSGPRGVVMARLAREKATQDDPEVLALDRAIFQEAVDTLRASGYPEADAGAIELLRDDAWLKHPEEVLEVLRPAALSVEDFVRAVHVLRATPRGDPPPPSTMQILTRRQRERSRREARKLVTERDRAVTAALTTSSDEQLVKIRQEWDQRAWERQNELYPADRDLVLWVSYLYPAEDRKPSAHPEQERVTRRALEFYDLLLNRAGFEVWRACELVDSLFKVVGAPRLQKGHRRGQWVYAAKHRTHKATGARE